MHDRTLTFFPVSAVLTYRYKAGGASRSCATRIFPVFSARDDQDLPSTRGYLSWRISCVYIILPHLPRRFGSYLATTPVARKPTFAPYGEWHVQFRVRRLPFIPSSAISRGHERKQYLHATAHPRPSVCTRLYCNWPLPPLRFALFETWRTEVHYIADFYFARRVIYRNVLTLRAYVFMSALLNFEFIFVSKTQSSSCT